MTLKFNTDKLVAAVPLAFGVAAVGCALFAPDVWAGDGGEEFEDVWTVLKDWTQGMLGRIIAIAMVIVGIIFGVARQSLISFAICIAGAMGLYQAPVIIEALLTADGADCPFVVISDISDVAHIPQLTVQH